MNTATDTPTIEPQIDESWKAVLDFAFADPSFAQLKQFLLEQKQHGKRFFPPGKLIFNAFNLTPFDKVRVVIVGQDPYHGPGQAHGLSFSVPRGVQLPPSLLNIFKELAEELDVPRPTHGNLESWAQQGILLLNATLTVGAGDAGSHQRQGWEQFTDAAIQTLNDQREGIIFVLWGKYAADKGRIIDATKHHVLRSAHPSPLSASKGFFGCGHFARINKILIERGDEPIEWALPEA